MRSAFLFPIFLLASCTSDAQKVTTNVPLAEGFRFEVEKLEPPKELLEEVDVSQIYKVLMAKEAGYGTKHTPNYSPGSGIVAQYDAPSKLVNFGYHSFFDGMYYAYAQHRPFTLSPDMVWLLIMQGFSQHVNNNPEELRKLFVQHEGKVSLVVQNNRIRLDNPNSPWEEAFPEFVEKIEEHTGKQNLAMLTADFSTTTTVSRLASQATLMDAMKKYFEYIVLFIGCGIPSINLEGTPEDWRKVLQKTKALEKYELGWWTKGLEPILQEFVHASEKKVNKEFWKQMFKYHETGGVYKSKVIDGWIVKFFPYDKDGKRNNLESLTGSSNLPDEICKVPLLHKEVLVNGEIITTPLELWAGFIGLQQNSKTFELKPEIGWMIKKAEPLSEYAVQQMEKKDRIELRVSVVPPEILTLKRIKSLHLQFTGNVVIPQEMSKISIGELTIRGKVSEEEAKRITSMFPDSKVYINMIDYRDPEQVKMFSK